MIGVVGKQKSVEMPSRFRISAMTSMTSIDRSSQRQFAVAGLRRSTNSSVAAIVLHCQPAAAGLAPGPSIQFVFIDDPIFHDQLEVVPGVEHDPQVAERVPLDDEQ